MHTDAEIDRLEELLSNVEAMPEAMCVSELDGYVAGLVLCPDMIMPSEWLPEVRRLDGEPEFKSLQQAQETIGAVMAHYNRVAENLADRRKPHEIVLEHAEGEDEPFWEFWVAGFFQAMRLRPDAWKAYWEADDENIVSAMSVMAALVDLEAGGSPLPKDKQAELAEAASDVIPSIIAAMNDWIKAQAPTGMSKISPDWLQAANSNTGPARSNKTGRNDLCPCGSDKRCCGAN